MDQVSEKNSNEALAELLTASSFDPNTWYISISIDKDISPEELLRVIRSQLPEELDRHTIHAQLKYQLRDVISHIHDVSRQAQAEAKKDGNDVFLTFSFDEDALETASRKKTSELLREKIFPVKEVPDTQISVNHIPDLTYVYQPAAYPSKTTSPHNSEAITVTIDPEHLTCYSGKKISADAIIWKETNIYSKPENDQYLEHVNMSRQDTIIHSTGSEKAERTYQSGLLLFVKNALDRVQKEHKPRTAYIFFSELYQPLKNDIALLLEKQLATKDIHHEFVSSDQFATLDVTSAAPTTDITEKIEKAKSEKRAITNLSEVCELLRLGNVDTLFLSRGLNQAGYIDQDLNCNVEPVEDSSKVTSIRPWLIRSALNISASVMLFDTQDLDEEVIAVARY